MISKFKESDEAANKIDIHIVLIRLVHVDSDIYISFNSPLEISPLSSVSASYHTVVDPCCLLDRAFVLDTVSTLKINKWELFQ